MTNVFECLWSLCGIMGKYWTEVFPSVHAFTAVSIIIIFTIITTV